jgi:hypothetical protein
MPITHEIEGEDRDGKLCQCQKCLCIEVCREGFDFLTRRDADNKVLDNGALYCQPCVLSGKVE